MKILPLKHTDLQAFLNFTNEFIGQNYYTTASAEELILDSCDQGIESSYCLKDDNDNIFGIRLTLPPGKWTHQFKEDKISIQKWNYPKDQIAYFKSLFLHTDVQKKGWGKKLSLASIEALKKLNTKAIVAHSWKESPGNSSFKYLTSLGFQPIYEHPLFWSEIDYICTKCGAPPCQCTATEVIKYLSD